MLYKNAVRGSFLPQPGVESYPELIRTINDKIGIEYGDTESFNIVFCALVQFCVRTRKYSRRKR